MNTIATVAVPAVLAAATAVAVSLSLRPSADDSRAMQLAQLETRLEQLVTANQGLRAELQVLRERASVAVPAAAPVERTEAPVVSAEQVAAAVDAYLAKRGVAAGATGEAAVASDAGFELERDFGGLVGTNYWEHPELWKKAFAAGQMDDVLAKFEDLAEANPNDPESQMQLARACMAYLQMDQSKWQLSMQADKQFDKVLALDDRHWEARFTKAVSYTFYPDFLGKKKDAIQHFETLIRQQDTMPVNDDQAQTYLYLGNLLAEREPDRAAEIWRRGLQRHPGNAELRQKAGQ